MDLKISTLALFFACSIHVQANDLIRHTSRCEAAILAYCKGERSAKMANKKLDEILDLKVTNEEKIRLLEALIKDISPSVNKSSDSDADGIEDSKDASPLLADITGVSWNVDSIDLAWNVKQQASLNKATGKSNKIEASAKEHKLYSWGANAEANVKGKASIAVDANGNPLKGFGLFNSGARAEAEIQGGASADIRWNRSSEQTATACINAIQTVNVSNGKTINDLHLSFSLALHNFSSEGYKYMPKPIPLLIGNKHIVDAKPVNAYPTGVDIPGSRNKPVRVLFKASLDTTKALELLTYMRDQGKPTIDLQSSGAQILSLETKVDAISRANQIEKATNTITINARDGKRSWLVAKSRNKKVTTLEDVLNAINEQVIKEQNKPIFDRTQFSIAGKERSITQAWVIHDKSSKSVTVFDKESLNKKVTSDLSLSFLTRIDLNKEAPLNAKEWVIVTDALYLLSFEEVELANRFIKKKQKLASEKIKLSRQELQLYVNSGELLKWPEAHVLRAEMKFYSSKGTPADLLQLKAAYKNMLHLGSYTQFRHAVFDIENTESSLKTLTTLARKKHHGATLMLALYNLCLGIEIPVTITELRTLLQAYKGSPSAILTNALLDPKISEEEFNRVMRKGIAEGFMIAKMYAAVTRIESNNGIVSREMALEILDEYANQGHERAKLYQVWSTITGKGLPTEKVKSVAALEKLAKTNADAQFLAASVYLYGIPEAKINSSVEKGLSYLELAAKQGHVDAADALARIKKELKKQGGK